MKNEKKFKLLRTTEHTILYYEKELHRIRALRDFGNVKAGEYGGYVEVERNLSHDGDCWIGGDAIVYGYARVYGNAQIYDNAVIYSHAEVYGNARVHGYAQIGGALCICGQTDISGNIHMIGNWEGESPKMKYLDNIQIRTKIVYRAKFVGDEIEEFYGYP